MRSEQADAGSRGVPVCTAAASYCFTLEHHAQRARTASGAGRIAAGDWEKMLEERDRPVTQHVQGPCGVGLRAELFHREQRKWLLEPEGGRRRGGQGWPPREDRTGR